MQIRQLFDSSRRSKLVKKILTRFAVAKKPARSECTQYRSPRIYLPTKLTDDSSFPFKEGDLLTILFFFNDTATTEIYTLSLHDALPTSSPTRRRGSWSTSRNVP